MLRKSHPTQDYTLTTIQLVKTQIPRQYHCKMLETIAKVTTIAFVIDTTRPLTRATTALGLPIVVESIDWKTNQWMKNIPWVLLKVHFLGSANFYSSHCIYTKFLCIRFGFRFQSFNKNSGYCICRCHLDPFNALD